jgi:hypothetical protein
MTQVVEALIPDITSYCNLWLAITCFGVHSQIGGAAAGVNKIDGEEHIQASEED